MKKLLKDYIQMGVMAQIEVQKFIEGFLLKVLNGNKKEVIVRKNLEIFAKNMFGLYNQKDLFIKNN